jgi:hypothetical protein
MSKTTQDFKEWFDSLFKDLSRIQSELGEYEPIIYHTCPQVLENNVLIWKSGGQWYFADNDRNKWGFSSHSRIIHICKYCGEVLN